MIDWEAADWGGHTHEDSYGSWTTAEDAERDGGAA